MICLLAAVAEETGLIREALTGGVPQSVNGITLLTGRLSGHDVCLAHSGIGKAAAAAAAVALLTSCKPQALWLFGCGGAYPGSGLAVGDLALADAEIFGDEGVASARGFKDLAEMGLAMRLDTGRFFNTWPIDRALHDWARPALAAHTGETGTSLGIGPFVTVSTCTGTFERAEEMARRTGGLCENMEGAAVALACQQLAVPLLEVRGISNLVEDHDPGRWDLPRGMAAAQHAIQALLRAWPE
jgi:futalosine hydrolase